VIPWGWLIVVAWAAGVGGFGVGVFWRDRQRRLPAEFDHDAYHSMRWHMEQRRLKKTG